MDLIIKDDGAGFDVSELRQTVGKEHGIDRNGGTGRALNGLFTIKSSPVAAPVHANFPLSEGANKP